MILDVAALRNDTPGVDHVIHLNNAGASLMPTPVIDAMKRHLELEASIGGYEAAQARAPEFSNLYDETARLVNGDSSEIAFTDSSTVAWDRVVYSLPHKEGDRILTTSSEYGSNWAAYLQLQERYGIKFDVVEDASTGEIDVQALESAIDDRTTLIALNHIPTNGGVVNPAAEVGRIAQSAGVPFLLDACQSVGQLPIDVHEIGCTFLTGTSRKFLRGPRGVGFAWVDHDALLELTPVFADNHSTQVSDTRIVFQPDGRRLESWERSYVNLAGFGAAVTYAQGVGIEQIWDRIRLLAALMRTSLAATDGVEVLDRGSVQGGIVSFRIEGRNAIEVVELLGERGINISHSTINSSPHDMRMRDLDELNRASVHAYNTEAEVEAFLDAVAILAG